MYVARTGMTLIVTGLAFTGLAVNDIRPVGASESAERTESSFDCVIRPNLDSDLATHSPGVLEKIHVTRGDVVTRGQLLASLHSDRERIELQLARKRAEDISNLNSRRAQLELALGKLKRKAKLYSNSIVSKEVSEEAEMEAKLAELAVANAALTEELEQLEVEQATLKLRLREIRSPIDGIVTKVHATIGEYIENGEMVLTVAEVRKLKIEGFSPIRYYNNFQLGMGMEVRIEAPFEMLIAAKISKIDKFIDTPSGTFGIQLEVDNARGEILPGLRCKALLNALPR